MSEEQQEQVTEQPGLGVMLRQAREKSGLTLEQIAEQLHLKASIIEGLEKEHFDESISVTFTKGYLKLYAKQVNLPEQDVLDAFDRINTKVKETTKLQSFSRRVSKQANDDKLMLVTYLVVIVVIALVVLWWFQQGRETTSALLTDTSVVAAIQNDSETTDTEVPENLPVVTAAESRMAEAEAPEVELTATEPDIESETATDVEASEPFIEDQVPEQIVSTPSRSQEADDGGELDTNQTTEPENLISEAEEALGQEATDETAVQLVFEFADDCWMNLVDGTGEAIAYGTKAKGRIMPVSGVPPFEVILGAPESVQISYNGQPIDMTQFPAGRTARFSLPLSNSAS